MSDAEDYLFAPQGPSSLRIEGVSQRFPVHRIYCVGRNYSDHVAEMGFDPRKEEPFFFLKPADALVAPEDGFPFPPKSASVHYEVELVVAIGVGGQDIAPEKALDHVAGYAVGLDMTRRDLQIAARDKGRPWDVGKAFDRSAPVGPLQLSKNIGHPQQGAIWLSADGERRQDADINDLIWKVPEIISILSGFFELKPGDLIMTGTPAGVGPIQPGSTIEAGINGIGTITVAVSPNGSNQGEGRKND